MGFVSSTLIFAACLLAISAIFAFIPPRHPDLWKSLPRHRNSGGIMGLICLMWCASYALPMFEETSPQIRLFITILVPVIAVLAYFFLSFIFARALGGLVVLGVTHLLGVAFVANPWGRALYAALCYLLAAGGIAIIISPWLLRDMLEKAAYARLQRYLVPAILTVSALTMVAIAVI